MSDAYNKLLEQIDFVSRTSGLGSLTESMANMLVGFNHRGVGNPVPYNQDNQGMVFFTRPRMNLSYDNLRSDRRLSILGATKGKSEGHYPQAIRLWLDPELARANTAGSLGGRLVDPYNAFIPLLTNNILSLSGWPDPTAEIFTADQGLVKETWSMVDGVDTIYSEFQLNATFRNVVGDPISLMINTWLIYMSLVYQGRMHPYPDSEMLREIDYQTRIYRLILDPTRSYIQKIAATGASFPLSGSLGQAFDFSSDTPFEQSRSQQITVPFQCIGAMYQDPILMEEFNEVVCMFNEQMQDDYRESSMVKISSMERMLFNYHGYPRIDISTNELQWWVRKSEYDTIRNDNASISSAEALLATAKETL